MSKPYREEAGVGGIYRIYPDGKLPKLSYATANHCEGVTESKFAALPEMTADQVTRAREWIEENCTPQATINKERWFCASILRMQPGRSDYISKGAFIQAALDLGYRVKKTAGNTYLFNMHSPAAREFLRRQSRGLT